MKLYYIIIVVIIIILLIYNNSLHYSVIKQKSTLDNNIYTVRNETDKELAANILSIIKHKSIKLIDTLKTEYPNDDKIIRLSNRFNPNNIYETSYKTNYTTYSVNKGEHIYLCLRNINKNFVDTNIIFFVMLHELAHLMTIIYDNHSELFWDNFKFLENKAIEYNLYKYIDYSKNSKEYCGDIIYSNP